METPVLSIVTPTRGNFTDYWLAQLLAVKGQVQLVLVYILPAQLCSQLLIQG